METLRLRNPLQSRISFSEADIHKLVPSRPDRRCPQNLCEWPQHTGRKKSSDTFFEDSCSPSISAIAKSGIFKVLHNKSELVQVMFTIFNEIFYGAVRKHFLCPICNDFLRKPLLIPGCGHTFCSLCLSSWFIESSLKSCPICRKFSSPGQQPVTIPTVDVFIRSVEKVWKHSHDSNTSEDTQQDMGCLLRVLGLPVNEHNARLLREFTLKSNLTCPSLTRVKKKWSFIQLIHNLRFAQVQVSNKNGIPRPGPLGWVQKCYKFLLELLKMIIPCYPQIFSTLRMLQLMLTGRGRILVRIPTPDHVCILLIAVILGFFTCTMFQYVLQCGLRGQLKLFLHFATLLTLNDAMGS